MTLDRIYRLDWIERGAIAILVYSNLILSILSNFPLGILRVSAVISNFVSLWIIVSGNIRPRGVYFGASLQVGLQCFAKVCSGA